MQLRKNHVESVERKIQHSLVEPVLRLKHSLQDPLTFIKTTTTTTTTTNTLLHEPSMTLTSLRGLPPPPITTASTASTSTIPIKGTTIASLGPIGTAKRIVQREGFFALYKGLTAVYMGIIPKMAIRFVSFEQYKEWLNEYTPMGRSTTTTTFTAGLFSGLTEAVLVVTPAEVCKVRSYIRVTCMKSFCTGFMFCWYHHHSQKYPDKIISFGNLFVLFFTDSIAITTSFLD
jgi:hypothetical protein